MQEVGKFVEIKVLGTGCPKCRALYSTVAETVKEMGVQAEVVKVEDIKEILEAGVMLTPGLMVNGVLKASGKVPSKAELKRYIEEELKS